MSLLLRGADAAAAMNKKTAHIVRGLRERGIVPALAIVRVGAQEDDLSYERSAMKRCAALGIETRSVALPESASEDELEQALLALGADESVDGILPLRPFPAHMDAERILRALPPEKDVDGVTAASLAAVYAGTDGGFAPCTAQAVLELLDYYRVPVEGKRAAVLGRSLTVGRPAAMLLLRRGATVTLCHSKTPDAAAIGGEADILIVCTGRRESVGAAYFRAGQTVVDVGIHYKEETGSLCGDVVFAEAESIVSAVTPVPGGVGALTTAVLAQHTARAAQRRRK